MIDTTQKAAGISPRRSIPYAIIALKEANETSYWLKLLMETDRITEADYRNTEKLRGNIRQLLIASCSTAKASIRNEKQK